jgi:hypothetical protein
MAKTKYKATGERIRNKTTGRTYGPGSPDAKHDAKAKRKVYHKQHSAKRRELIGKGLVKRGDGTHIDRTANGVRVVSAKVNVKKEAARKTNKAAKKPIKVAKKPAKKKTTRKRA